MKVRQNKKQIAVFYMAGFLIGILYANLMSKEYLSMTGMFNQYFVNQYVQTEIVIQEYLLYVTKARIVPMICLVVLGCLRIRKAVVVAFICWTGFLSGILFTTAVMKMGVKGIIFCIILLLPQFLFYVAGYMILLWYLYCYPESRWNISKTIFFIVLMAIGIILECYTNPILVKLFLNTL